MSADAGERVLSICMYTTRGRRLLEQAVRNDVLPNNVVRRDGVDHQDAHTTFLDTAFSSGTLKGSFGRLMLDPQKGGLLRVGIIWGDNVSSKSALATTIQEVAPIYDTDESSAAAAIETSRGQVCAAENQRLTVETELAAVRDRECSLMEEETRMAAKIQNLEEEKSRYSQTASNLESSLKDARKALEDAKNCLNKERQIIVGTIQYGGKDYISNHNIHQKVRECVLYRRAISLTNVFFEEDPWSDHSKSGKISVWSLERGRETLEGQEGSPPTFF